MARNEPLGPEETGIPSSEWIAYALDTGLRLASEYGLGLYLFNALRDRFEGVSGAILGTIASTIGQAVRAATGLSVMDLEFAPLLPDLPTVPGTFHPTDPGDRIIAAIDVPSINAVTGEQFDKRHWIGGLEFLTPADLISEANALNALAETESPRMRAALQGIAARLAFLAKRF